MKQISRSLPLLLALLVLASCGSPASSSSSVISSSSPASSAISSQASSSSTSESSSSSVQAEGEVGQACDLILYHALKYNPYITKSALLSHCGFSGQEKLTRGNGAILIYNAFKDTMGDFIGFRKYTMPNIGTMKNVPENAAKAVSFLQSHGIIVSNAALDFRGDEEMTSEYLNRIISRIHTYNCQSPVDDFYSTVNRNQLLTGNPSWDSSSAGYFTEIASIGHIAEWVDNQLDSSGSDEDLLAAKAYYSTYVDTTVRNDTSKGILKAIKEIYDCTDDPALTSHLTSLAQAQAFDPLFETQKGIERINSDKQTSATCSLAGMDYSSWLDSDITPSGLGRNYIVSSYKDLFASLGFSSTEATSLANALADLVVLAKNNITSLSSQTWGTYLDVTATTTFGTSFNLADHLKACGFSWADPSSLPYAAYSITKPMMTTALFNALFSSDATLEMKKAYYIRMEAKHYAVALPFGCYNHLEIGAGSLESFTKPANEYSLLFPAIGESLCKYYSKSSDFTADLDVFKDSFSSLCSAFTSRIDSSSWLSTEGKTAAKKKISAIDYCFFLKKSDGSDYFGSTLPYVSSTAGGTLYDNMAIYDNHLKALGESCLGKRENFDAINYIFTPLTANAFYCPDGNFFYVCPGLVASKSSKINEMTSDEYAGNIGFVVAHELTHSLDPAGCCFDQSGKYNTDFFPAADQAKFKDLEKIVIANYDTEEVMPGYMTSGSLVLNEAMADLGGTAILYQATKTKSDFVAQDFFAKVAQGNYSTATRPLYQLALINDVHPFGKARINTVFSSFQPFYDAYQVQEKDCMYFSPEKRVTVW